MHFLIPLMGCVNSSDGDELEKGSFGIILINMGWKEFFCGLNLFGKFSIRSVTLYFSVS